MRFLHLRTGWNDKEFQRIIQKKIDDFEADGWIYYDIKISSKGDNCLLIFKFKGKHG